MPPTSHDVVDLHRGDQRSRGARRRHLADPGGWVALTSVKPTNVINAETPTFYSFEPTGEHYVEIFDRFRMDRAIVNSLVTVGVSTLIVMILALPAAYAVARMGLMGGDTWALVILSLRFLPGVVVVLPYFKMATWFSLIDTQIVLIVVYVAFGPALRGLDSARVPAGFAQGGGGGRPARRAELAADHLPADSAHGRARHRGHGHLHLRLQLERVPLCALPHLRQCDHHAGRAAEDHRPSTTCCGVRSAPVR